MPDGYESKMNGINIMSSHVNIFHPTFFYIIFSLSAIYFNFGDVIDEQGGRFHQYIKVMKEQY